MKGITSLVIVLVLMVVAVLALGAVANGGKLIEAYVGASTRPESVTDLVMRSRTTASVGDPTRSNGAWFGAGVLAICIVALVGIGGLLWIGGQTLRQWRLTARQGGAPTPARQPQYEPPRVSGPQETPVIPNVRRVPQISAWSSEDEF